MGLSDQQSSDDITLADNDSVATLTTIDASPEARIDDINAQFLRLINHSPIDIWVVENFFETHFTDALAIERHANRFDNQENGVFHLFCSLNHIIEQRSRFTDYKSGKNDSGRYYLLRELDKIFQESARDTRLTDSQLLDNAIVDCISVFQYILKFAQAVKQHSEESIREYTPQLDRTFNQANRYSYQDMISMMLEAGFQPTESDLLASAARGVRVEFVKTLLALIPEHAAEALEEFHKSYFSPGYYTEERNKIKQLLTEAAAAHQDALAVPQLLKEPLALQELESVNSSNEEICAGKQRSTQITNVRIPFDTLDATTGKRKASYEKLLPFNGYNLNNDNDLTILKEGLVKLFRDYRPEKGGFKAKLKLFKSKVKHPKRSHKKEARELLAALRNCESSHAMFNEILNVKDTFEESANTDDKRFNLRGSFFCRVIYAVHVLEGAIEQQLKDTKKDVAADNGAHDEATEGYNADGYSSGYYSSY